jgi:hypothetical protein
MLALREHPVSLGCAAQWLKRPRAPRPLSALAVMACGRELSAVACGRRVWYETVACGRRVWPVADGCTLLYQDIAVRLTDDDTRSNVNIGLWPDDVGRDKTCRQCIPCSDHTCMFFIFAGLKFRPCISLFHPGQGVPASHIVTGFRDRSRFRSS